MSISTPLPINTSMVLEAPNNVANQQQPQTPPTLQYSGQYQSPSSSGIPNSYGRNALVESDAAQYSKPLEPYNKNHNDQGHGRSKPTGYSVRVDPYQQGKPTPMPGYFPRETGNSLFGPFFIHQPH